MPSRIIREGILDSRAVNALSDQGEILYRRLMSVVDDFGRFVADSDLIRARCFARQLDRWPPSRVSNALAEVSRVLADDGQPLVMLYAVGPKRFLEISRFDQRLRMKTSKFPDPSTGMPVTCPTDGSHLTDIRRPEVEVEVEAEETQTPESEFALTPKESATSEKSSEVQKEPNTKTTPDHPRLVRPAVQAETSEAAGWFAQWWAIYWHRDAKKAAQKAFTRNVRTEARFQQVMAATKAQAAFMLSKEKTFRPLGATWLNGERWEDELSAPIGQLNGSGAAYARPSSTDAVKALALRNLERTGQLL